MNNYKKLETRIKSLEQKKKKKEENIKKEQNEIKEYNKELKELYAMKDDSSPISELIYVGICCTVDDDFVRVSA